MFDQMHTTSKLLLNLHFIYSGGTVKPQSVGSKGGYHGLNGSRFTFHPTFKSFCHYTRIIAHIISVVSILFQGSTCPDFIENIYFLNWHSFQASSHQHLQIKYIFFSNFAEQ